MPQLSFHYSLSPRNLPCRRPPGNAARRRLAVAGPGLLLLLALLMSGTVFASGLNVAQEFAEARRLAQQGETAAAIAGYRALLKADPARLEAANNLAALYARDGRFEDARQVLEAAIAARPDFAAVYGNLAAIYLEMSRADYGKALQLNVGQRSLALRELATLQPGSGAPQSVSGAPAGVAPAGAVKPATAGDTPTARPTPVQQTLQDWAAAWSAQQAERYLGFYDSAFEPPGGLSRARWEGQRRDRLHRPKWIRVQLQDIQVLEQDDEHARVRLLQHYRSDSYADQTRKELQLRKTDAGWRIVAERSL